MLKRVLIGVLGLSGSLWGSGCTPDPTAGPRLDFIGQNGFTSNDRLQLSPGDTIRTRLLADNRPPESGANDHPLLTRLRITVDYTPNTKENDAQNTAPLAYVDTVLATPAAELVYQHQFSARTTSGQERWTYEIEDAEGKKASRSYRLGVRNPDSTLTYHRYTLRLEASRTATSASLLAAVEGLALPAYPVAATPSLQPQIDLALLPLANGGVQLAAPTNEAALAAPALSIGTWATRNTTQLKLTTLAATEFDDLTTTSTTARDVITETYDQALAPPATATGALQAGKVYAFRRSDGLTGVLLVEKIYQQRNQLTARLQLLVTRPL